MRVKVKFKDLSPRKKDKIIKVIKRKLPKKIEPIILERIAKGISPVANQGRFKKYSPSYLKQIQAGRYPGKAKRPVNLYLTGEMIKSFFINPVDRGFRIGFTDPKAWYHNDTGPGGKREFIRRLLPTIPGENFTRAIIKDIIKEIKKII